MGFKTVYNVNLTQGYFYFVRGVAKNVLHDTVVQTFRDGLSTELEVPLQLGCERL